MNVGVFSLMQWPSPASGLPPGYADRSAERVYGDEIAQAVEAERLGYDRAWFAEHHFSRYGIAPAIHLTLANVAARTHRIRLGTAVTILPFMHPLRAAEELAMLDVLSGGRIDWGVGRGYQRHEFDAFGVDIRESRPMLEEALDVIFRAWEPGALSHRGEHWSFEAVDVLPKPVQQPRIPTYLACVSPESVRWAGTRGLPILADQFSPFDRLEDHHRLYREASPGPAPEAIALRQVFVGRTREEAREAAVPALLWYYRMLAKVGSPARAGEDLPEGYEVYDVFSKLTGMTESGDFLDLLLDRVVAVGDAAEVTDRLTGLHESGYQGVICWMNFGGLPHELTVASMRRFVDDVGPKLPR